MQAQVFLYFAGAIGVILSLLILTLILKVFSGNKKNTSLSAEIERLERISREDAKALRQELAQSLLQFNDSIRQSVETQLTKMSTENASKLEQMRETVDEKLHVTLEKRLGESFSQVSERLEKVHQGLGEMQLLASDVGGLKRVLTNVKTIYDFPKRFSTRSILMHLVGMLLGNEKLLSKMGNKMNEGMLAPYEKMFKKLEKDSQREIKK